MNYKDKTKDWDPYLWGSKDAPTRKNGKDAPK